MADKIQCSIHGEAWETFVCEHLIGDSVGLGFNREEPTPEKRFPDAWCDNCEIIRAAHGEWNEVSEKLTKIRLLCSKCYERARIRNTRTPISLQELSSLRWKCGSCEEWHSGPCMDFGYSWPIYWRKDYQTVSDSLTGRKQHTFLDDDYCAIDGEHFFIRGVIQIPIVGSGETFCWGVWGSLKQENFQKLFALHEDSKRAELAAMFCWLSNSISEYPETLNLKMYAHIQKPGSRPLFELEPTDHPLAKEYYEGITPERVREIILGRLSEASER